MKQSEMQKSRKENGEERDEKNERISNQIDKFGEKLHIANFTGQDWREREREKAKES